MAINTQSLYDEMLAIFAVSASSERFRNQFFRGVNKVTRDLNQRIWQSIDTVSSLDEDIDVEPAYESCYEMGVKYYLTTSKEWGIDPDPQLKGDYEYEIRKAHTHYLTNYDGLKTLNEEDD